MQAFNSFGSDAGLTPYKVAECLDLMDGRFRLCGDRSDRQRRQHARLHLIYTVYDGAMASGGWCHEQKALSCALSLGRN